MMYSYVVITPVATFILGVLVGVFTRAWGTYLSVYWTENISSESCSK